MIDFVFDTETTGKAQFKAPINSPSQPRILQFACILADGDKILSKLSCLIQPGATTTAEAEKVHGITQQMLDSCAVSFSNLIPLLKDMISSSDNIVAHNLKFDYFMLQIMHFHANSAFSFWKEPNTICTMKSTTPILKLRSPWGGYKWPRLDEAYQHFMGVPLKRGNHDALEDTLACWEVLKKLREQKLPLLS